MRQRPPPVGIRDAHARAINVQKLSCAICRIFFLLCYYAILYDVRVSAYVCNMLYTHWLIIARAKYQVQPGNLF